MPLTHSEYLRRRRERYAAWRKLHPILHKVAVGVAVGTTLAGIGSGTYTLAPVPCAGGITVACALPTVPGGPVQDTTPPTVVLTAPTAGATLTGTVALTATATDNVAVAGVSFYIDGVLIGSEVTTAPYTVNLDTTLYANGPHTLSAISRDTSSNLSAASSISVTFPVQNTNAGLTSANLWVNTAAGATPTRSATLVAYNSANAYGSIGAALAAAQPTDQIGVHCNGAYPSQTLAFNSAVDTGDINGNHEVLIENESGCVPWVGAHTTLTADYHPVGYFNSCENDGQGAAGGCSPGTPGDAIVHVASTTGFTLSKPIIIAEQTFSGGPLTCTGMTATTFTGCNTGSTRDFYFRGDVGVNVTQDGTLDTGDADYVRLHGINANIVNLDSGNSHQGNHVTYEAAQTLNLSVSGGANDTVGGSAANSVTIGPAPDGSPPGRIAPPCISCTYYSPTSLLFDHVSFLSGNANGCVDLTNSWCHDETIFLQYVDPGTAPALGSGLTIRNSKFTKCEQYCIFASSFSNAYAAGAAANSNAPANVLIENNFFGPESCKSGSHSLVLNYPCSVAGNSVIYLRDNAQAGGAQKKYHDWTVRFNTFSGDNTVATPATTTASTMISSSNYGRANWGCDPKLTYDHDVTTLIGCVGIGNVGTSQLNVVNELTGDLHLLPAGPIGLGTRVVGAFPTTDIDGQARGSAPDAGADQFNTAPVDNGSHGAGMPSGISAQRNINCGTHTTAPDDICKYETYKPVGLNDGVFGGVPLVVYLHGSLSSSCSSPPQTTYTGMATCLFGTSTTSGSGQWAITKWPAEADSKGFIVVMIDGIDLSDVNTGNTRVWNGVNVNDATLIKDVITQVETSQSIGANINTKKLYISGFSAGSVTVPHIFCSESNSGAGMFSDDFSGASSIASLFAGFASASSNTFEGFRRADLADVLVNACTWPTAGTYINISSKGDSTQKGDPAQTGPIQCRSSLTGLGSLCVLLSSSTASQYATQYGCAAPVTTVIPTGGGFGSLTHNAYSGCTTPNAYEWDSLGDTGTNGPSHSVVNYNTACNTSAVGGTYVSCPDLIWAFWFSH